MKTRRNVANRAMARSSALSRVHSTGALLRAANSRSRRRQRMSTDAPPELFRREVLEARRNDFLGAIEIGPARYGRAFAAAALACVAAIACFLAFARYTRHERVEGELVPSAGLLALSAPSTGTVTRCLVREGEQVEQGQPIAEIRAPLDSIALGDTRALIDTRLREQLAALDSDLAQQRALSGQQERDLGARIGLLQRQLDLFETQRSLKQQQIEAAVALLERLRPLREKGILGAFEWDQRESALLDAKMQAKSIVLQRLDVERALGQARAELGQLAPNAAAKSNEIERKRADVAQSIARNESERAVLLRAPRAGTVTDLGMSDGQAVAAGQHLASLIPAGSELVAELWLPTRAAGFVAAGDRVVLRYHAFPYQKFGSRSGRVLDIGRSATPPDELERLRGMRSDEPMYRVKVALDEQDIAVQGRRLPLRTSMTLDADILMDRQRVIDWIAAPFRDGKDRPAGSAATRPGAA
jgi:membrane fusion protein